MCEFLKTYIWRNEFFDITDNTLIKIESELSNQVSKLSKGDTVLFSGNFLKSHLDFINEQSLSELGSMSNLFFTIKFAKVKKHNA
jgi:hypothetical protein